MPKRQKSGLLTLFASGVVCIVIATLRAAQITANTIKTNATIDGTWLAVWGMVESAVGTRPSHFSKMCTANIYVGRDHQSHPILRRPHPRDPQNQQESLIPRRWLREARWRELQSADHWWHMDTKQASEAFGEQHRRVLDGCT